jgi:cystathionine beta-synthase
MAAEIVEVMEAPFGAVATGDPVREAVELLTGDRQALTVTEDGRPVGIVTRADLLESLVS